MQSHPKGLYVLFSLEMWERFSYYSMRAILSLFMITVLIYSMPFASSIYGWFTGLSYLTPIIGGYLSDRYLGNRKSIYIGGLLIMFGQFALVACASLYNPAITIAEHSAFLFTSQEILFLIGLILLVVGNGFFKANISSMVRFLYPDDDERLDSGFTIFYMGVNLGAFIAPIIIGAIMGNNDPNLFKYAFLVAGVGIAIGLVMFTILKNRYVVSPEGEQVGVLPSSKTEKSKEEVLKEEETHEALTTEEKDRIKVIAIISFFAIFFFSAFEQAGISLTYFAKEHIGRTLPSIGFTVPIEWFQSIDPLSILILGSVFVTLWGYLASKNKEPSIPTKFGLGLIILALGFLILCIPGSLIDSGINDVNMLWLIGGYFIMAVAELCISPIGQSAVSKLSPVRFTSLLMGVWFAANAVSNILAGILSGLYPIKGAPIPMLFGIIPINGFTDFFLMFAIFATIGGIAVLLLKNKINYWMHGII